MSRLSHITKIPKEAAILDIGAAAGGLAIAFNQLGYRCRGVEPSEYARDNASELAKQLGVSVEIRPGTAENLPFQDDEFNIVLADNVMEHVNDIDRAFSEAFRVLKPGGVFWFYASSSMCPRQYEIRGFPLFGWYPDGIKRRIMHWAKVRKPHLVGYTDAPAINWFTPWKAIRLLRLTGFTQIYDRWDLRAGTEKSDVLRLMLRIICSARIMKLLTDVCVPECSYAAIK